MRTTLDSDRSPHMVYMSGEMMHEESPQDAKSIFDLVWKYLLVVIY